MSAAVSDFEGRFDLEIVLQAFDLAIDESSFTGETEPAAKSVEVSQENMSSMNGKPNVAFMGTLVRCGSGKVS